MNYIIKINGRKFVLATAQEVNDFWRNYISY